MALAPTADARYRQCSLLVTHPPSANTDDAIREANRGAVEDFARCMTAGDVDAAFRRRVIALVASDATIAVEFSARVHVVVLELLMDTLNEVTRAAAVEALVAASGSGHGVIVRHLLEDAQRHKLGTLADGTELMRAVEAVNAVARLTPCHELVLALLLPPLLMQVYARAEVRAVMLERHTAFVRTQAFAHTSKRGVQLAYAHMLGRASGNDLGQVALYGPLAVRDPVTLYRLVGAIEFAIGRRRERLMNTRAFLAATSIRLPALAADVEPLIFFKEGLVGGKRPRT